MSATGERWTEATGATAARRPVRRITITALLAIGLGSSVVGPALPGLRATFGLTLSEAGLLAVAGALGYMLGGLLGGMVADRWDRRHLLLIGVATLLIGMGGVATAPVWAAVLVGLALFGVGGGLVEGPANALVSQHSGEQRGADLNLAHAFFGVGAVIGPLLAGGLLTAGLSWRLLLAPALLTTLVLAALVWRLRLPPAPVRLAAQATSGWSALRSPLAGVLALLLGLYVGVEMMVGTWAYSHLRITFAAGDAVAGLATALYWGGLTAGRLIMGTVGARIGPHALIVGNIVGAAVALGLLVAAPTLPLAIGALVLIGLALANVFPAVLALAGAAFPRTLGAVTGGLIATSGLGGAIFPWLTGVVAERAGLAAALGGGLVLLALMLLAARLASRLHRQQAAARAARLDAAA